MGLAFVPTNELLEELKGRFDVGVFAGITQLPKTEEDVLDLETDSCGNLESKMWGPMMYKIVIADIIHQGLMINLFNGD